MNNRINFEFRECPLCGGAPTIDLEFDGNGNYIIEVKCAQCDAKVIGDNIKTARARWNEYAMMLSYFVAKMGYKRR